MKIIKIDGIRGIFTAAFCVVCGFAGFVIFPGQVIAHYWNLYLVNLYMFPQISVFQGVLLWLMIGISYCILTSKKGFALSFQETPFPPSLKELKDLPLLSEQDLKKIVQRAKSQSKNVKTKTIMNTANPFEKLNQENNSELSNQNNENEKKEISK